MQGVADTRTDAPVDLLGPQGTGPLWGLAAEDLNATLLAWPAGHEVAEHSNDELDVLLVVLAGGGAAVVDGREQALRAGTALLVAKGSVRLIRAGADGVRYLSVHRRRGPLQIQPLAPAGPA
jgi:quercetin dioxygenase-like cupin family protein